MTAAVGHDEPEFWREEPWTWVRPLRRFATDQPLWTDLVIAVLIDVLTAIPLIGDESRWWVWVLDQLLVLPLVFRRRRPFAVFLAIAAVGAVQWFANVSLTADAAFLLALYTVAEFESRWHAIAAASILEVGVIVASARFKPVDNKLVNSLVFLTAMELAALFIATTLRARRAYLESVVDRASRLEVERDQQARLAATRERTRIAREMHDIVAHNLSVMIALADGASLTNAEDPAAATEAMQTVSSTGRDALNEMRRLLGILREDDAPSGLTPQPGLDQIGELADRLRQVGRDVEVAVGGTPRPLTPTEDATAYRIVQECLTNVVKHAVDATRVDVRIDWQPDALEITVVDDGAPAAASRSGGHGLDGIAERVWIYDGEMAAGPGADGGWQVRTRLPIEAS